MNHIFDFFVETYKNQSVILITLEFIAFVAGILSVVYAKKENILVYPSGLIATMISIYFLYVKGYLGDMMMNGYYSIMSIYGWWNWSRKKGDKYLVQISYTNFNEKLIGLVFFVLTILVTFFVYKIFDYEIKPENYIDIFTSGIFFTAMWYMSTKKIENWTLWIIGDLITIPLYAYRGLGMLSLQYLIFTILAIQGYRAWKKSLHSNPVIL